MMSPIVLALSAYLDVLLRREGVYGYEAWCHEAIIRTCDKLMVAMLTEGC